MKKIDTWNWTRNQTLEFLRAFPYEQLNARLPRPGLDTVAKHGHELALVEIAYVNVIDGKALDFDPIVGLTDGSEDFGPSTVEELTRELRGADDLFGDVSARADWSAPRTLLGASMSCAEVVELMTRHETLHLGQLITYAYLLGVEIPPGVRTAWALPLVKNDR